MKTTTAIGSVLHLTTDQIDDLLIGEICAATAAHLETCAECTERVAAMRAPLSAFETVSLEWAERRSATLPAIAVGRVNIPITARLTAAAALCVALVFGVTDPALRSLAQPRNEAFSGASTAATNEAGAPNATSQILRDNQMLSTVAQETSDVQDSAAGLGLTVTAQPRAASVVRD